MHVLCLLGKYNIFIPVWIVMSLLGIIFFHLIIPSFLWFRWSSNISFSLCFRLFSVSNSILNISIVFYLFASLCKNHILPLEWFVAGLFRIIFFELVVPRFLCFSWFVKFLTKSSFSCFCTCFCFLNIRVNSKIWDWIINWIS